MTLGQLLKVMIRIQSPEDCFLWNGRLQNRSPSSISHRRAMCKKVRLIFHDFPLPRWSFDVTLYEFYSLGQTPYRDIAPVDLLNYLNEGNRLPKPELCSNEMYEIVKQCWCTKPDARPSLDEVVCSFSLFNFISSDKSRNIQVSSSGHKLLSVYWSKQRYNFWKRGWSEYGVV